MINPHITLFELGLKGKQKETKQFEGFPILRHTQMEPETQFPKRGLFRCPRGFPQNHLFFLFFSLGFPFGVTFWFPFVSLLLYSTCYFLCFAFVLLLFWLQVSLLLPDCLAWAVFSIGFPQAFAKFRTVDSFPNGSSSDLGLSGKVRFHSFQPSFFSRTGSVSLGLKIWIPGFRMGKVALESLPLLAGRSWTWAASGSLGGLGERSAGPAVVGGWVVGLLMITWLLLGSMASA